MRKLYFGGSFNPIHHGHLICARAIAEAVGFDQVVLVPSAQPPHKPVPNDMAPATDRLRMCQLAVADTAIFSVDDLELHRPGLSYTIDSIRHLKSPDTPSIYWLIGADMLAYLPQWHQPERLVQEANLIVMARPGWTFDWLALPKPFRVLQANVVTAPLIDISSTQIRARVAAGRDISFFVPREVSHYIHANGLYRAN